MRFVHTADVHLDACFASAGFPAAYANRRRQSLRDVFHSIITRAGQWPAEALLISGDLFDLERVTRDTIAFLRAEFESLRPIPVIIAPGNHDPFVASSPYVTESWPDNVFIFSKPEWTSRVFFEDRLVVHGFAFDGYDISKNPFGTLEIDGDNALHVAVAHGSERGHQPPDGKLYAPFDASDAAVPGLAYMALGHFHSVTQIEGDFDTCIYYSGAPEGHDFSECGPHHFLEVEIGDDKPVVRAVPSSRVVYASHAIECDGLATSQDIIEAVRAFAADGARQHGVRIIARIAFTGVCPSSIMSELSSISDAVSSEFEHLVLLDQTRSPDDYEELAKEASTLGVFVRRMNSEIQDEPDPGRQRVLERAREVGLAAYRDERLAIRGLDTVLTGRRGGDGA